jgi:hypothetical protein
MTLEALAGYRRDGPSIGRPISSDGDDLKRRWLTLALLFGTWIPMAFLIGVGVFGAPHGGLETTRSILIFLGLVHVPMTLILYVDKDFLPLVRADKTRYIYLPIVLIIGSAMIFTLGGVLLQASATLLLVAWQAYHYGRQNIGVYVFASLARGWRARPAERRALELTTICGVCGTFKVLGLEVASGYLHGVFDLLFRAGSVAFIGIVLFSVYRYLKHRGDFPLTKAVFFFTLLLFFLPLFVSSGMDGAFYSYATAHGIQYITLVTILSVNLGASEGRRGVSKGMIALATLLVLFGLVGARAADLKAIEWVGSSLVVARTIDFAAGIGVGATIAHFVIDAGAWRLSQPSARTYMTKRFGFLFKDRLVGSRQPTAPLVLS